MQQPCKRGNVRTLTSRVRNTKAQGTQSKENGGMQFAEQIRDAAAAAESLLLLPRERQTRFSLTSSCSGAGRQSVPFAFSTLASERASKDYLAVAGTFAGAAPLLQLLERLLPFAAALGVELACLHNRNSSSSEGSCRSSSSTSCSSAFSSVIITRSSARCSDETKSGAGSGEERKFGKQLASTESLEDATAAGRRVSVTAAVTEGAQAVKIAEASAELSTAKNDLEELLRSYVAVSPNADELLSLFQVVLFLWPASATVATATSALVERQSGRRGGAFQQQPGSSSNAACPSEETATATAAQLVPKLESLAEVLVLLLRYLVAAPATRGSSSDGSVISNSSRSLVYADSLPRRTSAASCTVTGRAIGAALVHPVRLHALATLVAAPHTSSVSAAGGYDSASAVISCPRGASSLGSAVAAALARSPYVRLACWKLICAAAAAEPLAAMRLAAALNRSSSTRSTTETHAGGTHDVHHRRAAEGNSRADVPSPLWEAVAAAVQGPQQRLLQHRPLRELRSSGIWSNPWPPSGFASNVAAEDTLATTALLNDPLYSSSCHRSGGHDHNSRNTNSKDSSMAEWSVGDFAWKKREGSQHSSTDNDDDIFSICSRESNSNVGGWSDEGCAWKKREGFLQGGWSVAWGRTFTRCCCLSRCCSPVILSLLQWQQQKTLQQLTDTTLQRHFAPIVPAECMDPSAASEGSGEFSAAGAAAVVCAALKRAAAAHPNCACREPVPQRYAVRQQVLQLLLLLLLHPDNTVTWAFLQQSKRSTTSLSVSDTWLTDRTNSNSNSGTANSSGGRGFEMLVLASLPLRFDRRLDALVWMVALRQAFLRMQQLQQLQQQQQCQSWCPRLQPVRLENGEAACTASAAADRAEGVAVTAATARARGPKEVTEEIATEYGEIAQMDISLAMSGRRGADATGDAIVLPREDCALGSMRCVCSTCVLDGTAVPALLPEGGTVTSAAKSAAARKLWRRLSGRRTLLRAHAQLLHVFTAKESVQYMLQELLRRVQGLRSESAQLHQKKQCHEKGQQRKHVEQEYQREEQCEQHQKRQDTVHQEAQQFSEKQRHQPEKRVRELDSAPVSAAWLLQELLYESAAAAFVGPPLCTGSTDDESVEARQEEQQKQRSLLYLEFLQQLRPVFLPPQQELLLSLLRRTPLHSEAQQQLLRHLSACMHMAPRQSTEFALSQLLLARLIALLPSATRFSFLPSLLFLFTPPASAPPVPVIQGARLEPPSASVATTLLQGLAGGAQKPAAPCTAAQVCSSEYADAFLLPFETLSAPRSSCSAALQHENGAPARMASTAPAILPTQLVALAARQHRGQVELYQLQEEAEKYVSSLIPCDFHLRQHLTAALLHPSPCINMLGLMLLRSCCCGIYSIAARLRAFVAERAVAGRRRAAAAAVEELLLLLCAAARDRLPDEKTLLNCFSKLQQQGYLQQHRLLCSSTQGETNTTVAPAMASAPTGASVSADVRCFQVGNACAAAAVKGMWPVDEVLLRKARTAARSDAAREREQRRRVAAAAEEKEMPDIHIAGLEEDDEDFPCDKGGSDGFDGAEEVGHTERSTPEAAGSAAALADSTAIPKCSTCADYDTLQGGGVCLEDVLRVGTLMICCCTCMACNNHHSGYAYNCCGCNWNNDSSNWKDPKCSTAIWISSGTSNRMTQAAGCTGGFVELLLMTQGPQQQHEQIQQLETATEILDAADSHTKNLFFRGADPIASAFELDGLLLFLKYVLDFFVAGFSQAAGVYLFLANARSQRCSSLGA